MKQIKDLRPGETFLDSFGRPLKVIKTMEMTRPGTHLGRQKVKVTFETESKRKMYLTYYADRMVEVL